MVESQGEEISELPSETEPFKLSEAIQESKQEELHGANEPLLDQNSDSTEEDNDKDPNYHAQPYYKIMLLKDEVNRRFSAIKKIYFIYLVIVLVVMVLSMVPYLAFVRLKHDHDSKCHNIPSPYDMLIAKNSTVILLNTTNARDELSCYKPTIEITANFPMSVYLLPCKNLNYVNYFLDNYSSIGFLNASNPLPTAFDERYPNYLVDGNISMIVNISTMEADSSIPEYIYFCKYTDYNQFQRDFISRSTKSYWMSYNGTQCHQQHLGLGHISILEDMFNISQPDYVFIGIGSTIEPLHRFQFMIRVSGQIISDPGHSLPDDSIKDSCSLDDQHHSCELVLNQTHDSEALCVIGSRPVDFVSTEAFGSLTVRWTSIKPYKTNIIKTTQWIMIGLLILGPVSLLVVLICCMVLHKPKKNNQVDQATKEDKKIVMI